jgi:hypothetical protein
MVAHMTEKMRVIVTIIAILELTKNKVVALSAIDGKDDIAIRQVTPVVPITAGASA